jgi:DNA-directed RNA polymerase subunit omega
LVIRKYNFSKEEGREIKMENNKYLLSMMVAKRAKELREGAKPLVESKHRKPTMIALEEIKAGKVYLKEEEGPLKDEEIFHEDVKPVKPEDISNKVEEPAKDEDLSGEVKELAKDEELSDEVEKPAEIEDIFKKDEESGKSKG